MKLSKKEFIKNRTQFSLGHLSTESFHSETANLSAEVQSNIIQAIESMQKVDRQALDLLSKKNNEVYELQKLVHKVFNLGGRVFLAGCGATGRLALSLEKIYRKENPSKDNVISFMAGGDYALIKSVESFEDNFEYGERQLKDLNFSEKDLLIGITEGGETSFVIGALRAASEISNFKPIYMFCNPEEQLLSIDRCAQLIKDDRYIKLSLNVGAMAISGSTRLQATSVQMITTGFALLYSHKDQAEFTKKFKQFLNGLAHLALKSIAPITKLEAGIFSSGGFVNYIADPDIAISVLTDTTERSPTFNLPGFEKNDEAHFAKSYLCLKDISSNDEAWAKLLGREIRGLSWESKDFKIDKKEILKFDISKKSIRRRSFAKKFEITHTEKDVIFELAGTKVCFELKEHGLLYKHMAVKMILNIHSTLMMGLNNRFESNMMTYVAASNMKLVDRAIRYARRILELENIETTDEQLVDTIFEMMAAKDERPIVMRLVERMRN